MLRTLATIARRGALLVAVSAAAVAGTAGAALADTGWGW